MAYRISALAAVAVVGILAGCVYDPDAHAYAPCCAYRDGVAVAAPERLAQATPPPPPTGEHEPFVEKFHHANVTNDGRLTREQARAGGLHMVASHFNAIDANHKGYVTLDDIRAARAAQQRMKANPPPPQ